MRFCFEWSCGKTFIRALTWAEAVCTFQQAFPEVWADGRICGYSPSGLFAWSRNYFHQ